MIRWAGGVAATHAINKVSSAAEVRTRSVELHFSWNAGVAEAEAESDKRVWAYKNRPRYGLILPPGTNVEFRIKEKSNYRFLARQGLLYSETAATLLALHVVRSLSNQVRTTNPVSRGGLAPAILRRVCDCMISHLSDDISLSELAAIGGLSVGHFAFAFKQSTGVSPHAWLRRRRIDTAKALLCSRDLNLSSIAASIGFANQSAFGVAFRKETGMTPTAWRRLHCW
jgi:AraC family transcriptional regulator